MPDRTQVNGVKRAQLVDGPLGQDFAGAQIPVAAEIEVDCFVLKTVELGDGLEDLHAFGGYFRAGAVAADDGDP